MELLIDSQLVYGLSRGIDTISSGLCDSTQVDSEYECEVRFAMSIQINPLIIPACRKLRRTDTSKSYANRIQRKHKKNK